MPKPNNTTITKKPAKRLDANNKKAIKQISNIKSSFIKTKANKKT